MWTSMDYKFTENEDVTSAKCNYVSKHVSEKPKKLGR